MPPQGVLNDSAMKKNTIFFRRLSVLLAATFVCWSVQAETRWVDVTSQYFKNPSFQTGDKSDWTFDGEAGSFALIRVGCIEMWQGWMHMSRQLQLPNGRYRVSVQSLFRFRRHAWAYPAFVEGTDERSAFFYAGDMEVEVPSEYVYWFDSDPGFACYNPDDEHWFPNSMEAAGLAFEEGAYRLSIETEVSDGVLDIGVYNDSEMTHSDNWLVVDNIKIEYLTEFNEPAEGDLCVNEVMAANTDVEMSPAFNFDGWVELYNASDKQLTLGGCYLSDDAARPLKWALPAGFGTIPAHGCRRIWCGSNEINSLHAPFSLDCEGGELYFSDSSGRQLFAFHYPAAISRTAYARTTDGGNEWGWTAEPTPDASNATSTFCTERSEAPTVTDGGLFDDERRVVVRAAQGAAIYYTTDGTTPTPQQGELLRTHMLHVTETTTYRFRAYEDGKLPSEVVARTYLKREREHLLPIVYVSCPDEYLYDDSIGVYVRGVNGRTGNGQSSPVNWNMDWNRPVNFQYMVPGQDDMVFNQDVDFRISGGWTRANNPKSFKLKADRVYEGKNTMDYPFFPNKPYIRNKALQVRRGGNDSGARIKDAALHEIIRRSGIDLDVMSYQPVVHYINGRYMGLINLREPNNKDFGFANFGISKDDMEIYEQSPDSGAYMMLGSSQTLLHLYDLSADCADAAVYDEICSLVDMDEFMNYMAAELYLGSWDWPDNNLKAYRKAPDGRFRVTFFDLDAAFGTDGRGMDEEGEISVGGNTFRWIDGMQWHRYDYIYDTAERRYGEIKFCTFFMNLMQNADFRRKFAATFCLMGSVFDPERTSAILDELGDRVRPTMSQEWASPDGSLEEIRSKLKNRGASMTKQMKQYERMQLTDVTPQKVHLRADTEGCNIYVNDVLVPYGEYSGELFAPVRLKAEPRGGNRFIGWRYAGDTQYITGNLELDLPAGTNLDIEACFGRMTRSERRRKGIAEVSINEVMATNDIYQNDYFKRSDWLELYNATGDTIDLEGWYLSDDPAQPQKYQITAAGSQATTRIAPYGHLLVWCDNRQPLTELHADFKLAAEGGMVSLTSPDAVSSSVLYYPPHTGMESVARFPDGATEICVTNIPTIGYTNRRTSYLVPTDQKALGVEDAIDLACDLTLQRRGDDLVITSSTATDVHAELYSLDGRALRSAHLRLQGGRATFSLANLPAGIYIARAADAEGRSREVKIRK